MWPPVNWSQRAGHYKAPTGGLFIMQTTEDGNDFLSWFTVILVTDWQMWKTVNIVIVFQEIWGWRLIKLAGFNIQTLLFVSESGVNHCYSSIYCSRIHFFIYFYMYELIPDNPLLKKDMVFTLYVYMTVHFVIFWKYLDGSKFMILSALALPKFRPFTVKACICEHEGWNSWC